MAKKEKNIHLQANVFLFFIRIVFFYMISMSPEGIHP